GRAVHRVQQFRDARHGRDRPDARPALVVAPEREAGLAHARRTDAFEPRVGIERADLARQRYRDQLARGFSGAEEIPHTYLAMPRCDGASRKATISRPESVETSARIASRACET